MSKDFYDAIRDTRISLHDLLYDNCISREAFDRINDNVTDLIAAHCNEVLEVAGNR